MSDKPIFRTNANGEIFCATHFGSYDMKCGICALAGAAERGRQKGEQNIRDLVFTYLKDGLTPEEAATKARENYTRLAQVLNR